MSKFTITSDTTFPSTGIPAGAGTPAFSKAGIAAEDFLVISGWSGTLGTGSPSCYVQDTLSDATGTVTTAKLANTTLTAVGQKAVVAAGLTRPYLNCARGTSPGTVKGYLYVFKRRKTCQAAGNYRQGGPLCGGASFLTANANGSYPSTNGAGQFTLSGNDTPQLLSVGFNVLGTFASATYTLEVKDVHGNWVSTGLTLTAPGFSERAFVFGTAVRVTVTGMTTPGTSANIPRIQIQAFTCPEWEQIGI